MAIEQFGESLLSSQRARQEKLASQQRKQERKEVLIGLGVKGAMSLANTALKDKAESFLQNEKVLAARSQYKAGINTASTILDEQKKIAESAAKKYVEKQEEIAIKIELEGAQKADDIMIKAREQADKLG